MTTIAKTTAAVLALALALPMAAHAQTSAMTAPKADTNNPNVVAYTTKTGKVIHYDCSKAGNKNKAACKGH